jgi:hypothetical protein
VRILVILFAGVVATTVFVLCVGWALPLATNDTFMVYGSLYVLIAAALMLGCIPECPADDDRQTVNE